MHVFVTGPTGYIGHAVVTALISSGHRVSGLARSAEAAAKVEAAGATVVRGSLGDAKMLADSARAADAVIHLGATGGADNGQVDAAAVGGILQGLAGTDKRLIYTSGCWIYGDTRGRVADENAPLDPPTIVAWRPAVERAVLDAAGIDASIIRPGIVYGGLRGIPGMLLGGARDGAVAYVASGEQHWPLIHVRDLADLYVLALENAPAGAIYNGVSASEKVVRIAEAAAAHLGLSKTFAITLDDARAAMGPFADALALDQQLASPRANAELGWEPSAPTIFEDYASGGTA